MTDKDFNLDTALAIVSSTDSEFKVDFDDLWQWCGYSRKDSAKRTLDVNFEEGIDFSTMTRKNSQVGRPSELIFLTIDAAKEFAMLAQTDKGKLVRKYFVQAEKQSRESIQPLSQLEMIAQIATIAAQQERRLIKQEKTTKELDNRISAIEQQKLEAEAELREIERSQEKPLKATTRSNINRLVRSFVSVTHIYHQEAWNKLYLELKYRYGYDAKTRARNRGIKPLDCVDQDGMMEKLYAIASEIL